MSSFPSKPLVLNIAAQERSIGALLAQKNESHKGHALYYLSQTLISPELNYTPIKKTCITLVFYIQKLRHYMQAYTIHLSAQADLVRYVMSKLVLTGRLSKWWLQSTSSRRTTRLEKYESKYGMNTQLEEFAIHNLKLITQWEWRNVFLNLSQIGASLW